LSVFLFSQCFTSGTAVFVSNNEQTKLSICYISWHDNQSFQCVI